MNEEDNKIIDKIQKLLALSSSDNENEARAAMLKAQELMAKYEIDRERLDGKAEERPVVGFTSPSFRDDWTSDIAQIIAENFKCRLIILRRRKTGGTFRLRFFGFPEDAEICINIFNYATKVVRRRMATLRAIYADAGREFGRDEKKTYVYGFCYGLQENFEEQKAQSEAFALALVTPKEVNEFVEAIPDLKTIKEREFEYKRENNMIHSMGYVDGKAFRNAGDKERLDA